MLPILTQSFWRDEAFSALLAAEPIQQIIALTTKDVSPPFYYMVLHYWMVLFGNSEVVIRSLSFLFHLFTALTVFLIARKLIPSGFSQGMIFFTTLLNPFLLQYAFEARTYSLLAFLSTLTTLCILNNYYILAGIVLAIMVLSHNFGLFTFTAVIIWFLYIHGKRIRLSLLLQLSLLPFFSFLFWGSVIWNQWKHVVSDFWIKPATSGIFLHTLETYAKGDISYEIAPLLYITTLILLFFTFSYWINNKQEEETEKPLLFAYIAGLPLLITYFISALFAPIYHERYLIGSLPMIILFVAYSLYKLYITNSRIRTVLIAVLTVYCVILFHASEEIVNTTTKPALNWGISQILLQAQPNDIIVPKDFINFLEAKYYVARHNSSIKIYAYKQDGNIPWYVGGILFTPRDVITTLPKHTRTWQLNPDGGYILIKDKL